MERRRGAPGRQPPCRGAEVGNGRDAGEFGNDVGVAKLQRIGCVLCRSMAHRLTVRTQCRDCRWHDVFAPQQCVRRVGETARNLNVERAEFIQCYAAIALRESQNALAQFVGVGVRERGVQPRCGIETRQRDVDAVGAGTRDQAEKKSP